MCNPIFDIYKTYANCVFRLRAVSKNKKKTVRLPVLIISNHPILKLPSTQFLYIPLEKVMQQASFCLFSKLDCLMTAEKFNRSNWHKTDQKKISWRNRLSFQQKYLANFI